MDVIGEKNSNKTLTLVLYILYMIAILTGGIFAIIALIINYVKLKDVKDSLYESHFIWQIRTFWGYLIANVIAFIPFFFLFFTENNPNAFATVAWWASAFCLTVVILAWIWVLYRAIRGLVNLNDNKPMYE